MNISNKKIIIKLPIVDTHPMFKYLKLADYLKQLLTTKCQLKDLIYDPRSKVDPRVAYSNLSLILNNIAKFQQMHRQLLKIIKHNNNKNKNKNKDDGDNMKINNKYLLFVVVAQYINVGKIVGGGKLKKLVMDNIGILPDIQVQSKINRQVVNIRLRQCCTNKQQLHKWKQILAQYSRNNRPYIPDLYSIPQQKYSQISAQHPNIRSSSACVIQSLSSNLPAYLLFESLSNKLKQKQYCNVKFDIIDACAAPGNKTIQLAEYLGNRGKVWAFQRDQRRYQMLNRNIKKYQTDNVQSICADFLTSQPDQFPKVRLIMLDPSCSGSGMLINFSRENTNLQQTEQLSFQQYADQAYANLSEQQKLSVQQLKQLQLSLLRHATSFKPFRISYSTCSIYREENQAVVKQFLKEFPQYYVKPMWERIHGNNSSNNFIKNGNSQHNHNQFNNDKNHKDQHNTGILVGGFGKSMKNCIRVDPRTRKSDGFFVCIFARRKTTKQ